MKNFRANPIKELAGSPVTLSKDFAKLESIDFVKNEVAALQMPTTSNVLQYFTEDGTKVSVRPSGTEPKIKFYIEVQGPPVASREEMAEAEIAANKKIEEIKEFFGI